MICDRITDQPILIAGGGIGGLGAAPRHSRPISFSASAAARKPSTAAGAPQ